MKNSNVQDPPQQQLQSFINLYSKGHYNEVLKQVSLTLVEFPTSVILYNLIGAANKVLGNLDKALEAYTKALSIKPDYAEAYNNMGNALQEQGKVQEAIEAFNKAISIKHSPSNLNMLRQS